MIDLVTNSPLFVYNAAETLSGPLPLVGHAVAVTNLFQRWFSISQMEKYNDTARKCVCLDCVDSKLREKR